MIIEMGAFLRTPPGAYLLSLAQAQVDRCVVNRFGFHAMQLGMPQLHGLRANRMPHRWLALTQQEAAGLAATSPTAHPLTAPWPGDMAPAPDGAPATRADLVLDVTALPLDSRSLDLILLPHTLELSPDPHRTLSEAARVLVPEGRILILGFNPHSWWAWRQHMGQVRQAVFASSSPLFLPSDSDFFAPGRLKDWLRLLDFDVGAVHFFGYRPPLRSEQWLTRSASLDPWGARWCPPLGAVYAVEAVKRVRGMRLVGLAPDRRQRAARAAMVPTPRVAAANPPSPHQAAPLRTSTEATPGWKASQS